MKFILRDDDASYYTEVCDLIKIYDILISNGIKVSFAVIPKARKVINHGNRYTKYYLDEWGYLYENKELVEWLKGHIRNNNVEIMQHGFEHTYAIKRAKKYEVIGKSIREMYDKKNIKPYLYPECFYKKNDILMNEIKLGKEILEDTFNIKIKDFVPPSNLLSRECSKIVALNGMNISGMIKRNMNRVANFHTIRNYILKNLWKLIKKETYPYILKYKDHKELAANTLGSATNIKKITNKFEKYQAKDKPFVLATHYWELIDNSTIKDLLYSLIEKGSFDACLMREVFDENLS